MGSQPDDGDAVYATLPSLILYLDHQKNQLFQNEYAFIKKNNNDNNFSSQILESTLVHFKEALIYTC